MASFFGGVGRIGAGSAAVAAVVGFGQSQRSHGGGAGAGGQYAVWAAMRESSACMPAGIHALDQTNIETGMITLGHAAVGFAHSNQFVGYQAVIEADVKVDLVEHPGGETMLYARTPDGRRLTLALDGHQVVDVGSRPGSIPRVVTCSTRKGWRSRARSARWAGPGQGGAAPIRIFGSKRLRVAGGRRFWMRGDRR